MTAREHYLCHWLLVKRYNENTNERMKMLKAWFIMSAIGNNLQRPTISMNTYSKYKEEFSRTMKIAQTGQLNSQYGKHWFTNLRTGESTLLFKKPDKFWIEGRNWFNREGKCLYSIKTKKENTLEEYIEIYNPVKKQTIKTALISFKKHLIENQKLWNEFHSGNYKNLLEFAKVLKISKVALRNRFYRYIPLYKNIVKSNVVFKSNKDLIGVYEQLEFSKF